jgi:hypothetical protein
MMGGCYHKEKMGEAGDLVLGRLNLGHYQDTKWTHKANNYGFTDEG